MPYPDDSNVLIQDFYNGGTVSNGASGVNYGVSFSRGATVLCLNTSGTSCSNTSKGGSGVPGSEFSGLYFPTLNPTMNVAAGFDTGFSFAYTNPFNTNQTVNIYSGLDGTGILLASISLRGTSDGGNVCPGYGAQYCPFTNFSLTFSGTARSVRFAGDLNSSVFDDFTFGSTVVGGGNDVPEPASLALLTLGMLGLAGTRRTRKAGGRA